MALRKKNQTRIPVFGSRIPTAGRTSPNGIRTDRDGLLCYIPTSSSAKSRELALAPFQSATEPVQHHQEHQRDSLECDESLGILTPEQMVDVASTFAPSRTPSSENIQWPHEALISTASELKSADVPAPASPNLASVKDISLGIIDVNALSTLMSDTTTVNMELSLDSVHGHSYVITRLEQTPSPEELPLDSVPAALETDTKTEPSKSKTSSFITSITSITSLDTGYQGDGEMSRPGSRGPDHSPLTRRPLQRPQPRRHDPMTDSDFYTESDADNHEEHPSRGVRLARVIDGTLYGVDPQAAADIYVNNRENMDSSGIFTDIEGNTRMDELIEDKLPDASPSPSDSSTKTISNDSQNNMLTSQTFLIAEVIPSLSLPLKELVQNKRKSPPASSAASSPINSNSPRHALRDEAKKYKMPKRNVVSKVKALIDPIGGDEKKVPRKKCVGRWDEVMSKISKNQGDVKPNLKDVKSKVYATLTTRQSTNLKNSNNNTRRVRTRTENPITKKPISVHSSTSDLSTAAQIARNGTSKKQRDVVRVAQVLTPQKLHPRDPLKSATVENNKKATFISNTNEAKNIANRKTLFPSKQKKTLPANAIKDNTGKAAIKGRTPSNARPQQNRASASPKAVEALAVLVQHLVFNLEAFQNPSLKKQLEKARFALQESREKCAALEQDLAHQISEQGRIVEKLQCRFDTEVSKLTAEHETALVEFRQYEETQNRIRTSYDHLQQQLEESERRFDEVQKQREHDLEILKEENEAIREEMDEKKDFVQKLEGHFKNEEKRYVKELELQQSRFNEQIELHQEEVTRLKQDNNRLISSCMAEGKEGRVQTVLAEVESLRAVLELKQNEAADLRKQLAEANQKAELLPATLDKVATLTARCEDLESQLERKNECEMQMMQETKKCQELLKEEMNQNRRLSQYNEELQWKLKQNKEVVSRVLEQTEDTTFNRSLLSASLNEKHANRQCFERAMSFRENRNDSPRSRKSKNSYDLEMDDTSPPSSPKVKGVVEKSDSVSYVLEMEESPEMIANRIVRRSFRNGTPPKTTPVRCLNNTKRPRIKINPLSLSASASAILPGFSKTEYLHSRSACARNTDSSNGSLLSDEVFTWDPPASSSDHHMRDSFANDSFKTAHSFVSEFDNFDGDDEEEEIQLPALPKDGDDAEKLPLPKRRVGEELMVSGSTSEDDSTSSSSEQL